MFRLLRFICHLMFVFVFIFEFLFQVYLYLKHLTLKKYLFSLSRSDNFNLNVFFLFVFNLNIIAMGFSTDFIGCSHILTNYVHIKRSLIDIIVEKCRRKLKRKYLIKAITKKYLFFRPKQQQLRH